MSSKPETTYANGVNKHLPGHIYAEKTNNPYRGGTPDFYYEARYHAWIEYKFIEKIPHRIDTMVVPALTPLQMRWLQRVHDNGHRAGVIIGSPKGGVLLTGTPGVWKHGISAGEFVERLKTKKEMAELITALVSP